jgi:hypothetical protein
MAGNMEGTIHAPVSWPWHALFTWSVLVKWENPVFPITAKAPSTITLFYIVLISLRSSAFPTSQIDATEHLICRKQVPSGITGGYQAIA